MSEMQAATEQTDRPKISDFVQVVLSHIGMLTPRHTGEIHQRVVDDWGEISRRATERALSILRKLGLVARTPDGYLQARRAR